MKKQLLIGLIFVLLIVTPVFGANDPNNNVIDPQDNKVFLPLIMNINLQNHKANELIGKWYVDLYFGNEIDGEKFPVKWLIQEIEPHPEQENVFLATGCMETISTGEKAPLSMVATYLPEENRYEIMLYSTVIPIEGKPFVIRFDGEIDVNGIGIVDDRGEGKHISENGDGPWFALHYYPHKPCGECALSPSLPLEADLFVHQDLALATPHCISIYGGGTRIVSSGMIVETSEGETFHMEPYTDIFSPGVDFITEFGYQTILEGKPISGEVYTFTLLDILGNPIPGATTQDIWTACTQGAPQNINLPETVEGGDVDMSWDSVDDAPGFDPDGDPQVGFYQIDITPVSDAPTVYGANWISSTSHVIPWADFEPNTPGAPNGFDYGESLSELVDGNYEVSLGAVSEALPEWGGTGLECTVFDSSQFFSMRKTGDELFFVRIGSIKGRVTNESGEPLQGIWVDACEFSDDPQFCRSGETNVNGEYYIAGVLPGDYRVQAGNESYAQEFYDDTYLWHEATPVTVNPGAMIGGIDFELAQGGSISGRVTNESGDPLQDVGLEVCEYVDEPQYCRGGQTDENGEYLVIGLLPGDYRVQAGNESYAREFFDDTYDWGLATPVEVLAGVTTTDINFELALGGSISGTVFDEFGTPLNNIAVDIEEGGFGTCTDEEGNYMMSGM
ncbi:MAG: carboxypeptidase regulatory-like domain-containing protein, partial [Anaerolineales bacterium]